jgi:LCP family protein required for cell wall assembly
VGAVGIVSAGTLAAYLKYRAVYDSITRVQVPQGELGHRPPQYSTDSMNILVYGDDSRKGLTPHEQYLLHTGHDQSNNTDTIMLVHIAPGHRHVVVLSIPRDTMVPAYQCDSAPGYPGQSANPNSFMMINSVLQAGGPVCLWKTVEQQTGVRVDHFIGIGMLGFVKVVNDLGGVNVCVPFNVNDSVSGLHVNAGEQHINGIQALAFWRTREDLGTGSDLERIQRDQFMSAQVVKGVLGSGLLSNPIRLLSVVTDAAASMTTDAGMTASDLVSIAESFHSISGSNVQFLTVPNQPWVGNANRLQFEQPQASQVFSAIAHDVTVPKTTAPKTTRSSPRPTGGAQVLTASPSKVKVKVLNGSGISGLADKAATGLASRGFDVTGTGDAAGSGYTSSVIEYSSAADLALVNTLKRELAHVTERRDASLAPGTVDLIVGSDFTGLTRLPASPSPSASPSPTASASSVTGLAQSNGGITAAAPCASDSPAFNGPLSPLPRRARYLGGIALTSATASGSLRIAVTRRSASLAGCPVRSRSTQTERSPSRAAARMSCTQLLPTWIQLSFPAPVFSANCQKCTRSGL